jgi:hypothetical protein
VQKREEVYADQTIRHGCRFSEIDLVEELRRARFIDRKPVGLDKWRTVSGHRVVVYGRGEFNDARIDNGLRGQDNHGQHDKQANHCAAYRAE